MSTGIFVVGIALITDAARSVVAEARTPLTTFQWLTAAVGEILA